MMPNLSISKAWEETRDIVRRDGRLLAILSLALIGLPSLVLAVTMPQDRAAMEVRPVGETVAFLVAALIALLGQLALARMALQPSISVGGAISHGLSRMLPLMGAAILATFAIFALCIPLVGVAAAMGVSQGAASAGALPAAVIVVMLATIAAAIYLAVRLLLMTPVAAAERISSIAILARSWDLTRGHFWRLLGFIVMVLCALVLVSLAVALVVGSLVIMMFGAVEPFSLAALIVGLVQAILSAAFTALFVVMAIRIYVQLSGNSSISGS